MKAAIPDEVYDSLRRSLIVLKNNKALSLIGLATKAGKTVSGEFSTEKSIKTGKGYLAIVAGDSSDNTKKKFRNMCEFYEVPLYILSDKETLGHAWARNSVQPGCTGLEFCRSYQEGAAG